MARLTVKTRRLVVRPFSLADYGVWAVAKRALLPKRNRFDRDPPLARNLTRAWFSAWLRTKRGLQRKDALYVFGVFDRATGALYGQVSLLVIARHRLQIASLGYEIHNSHWGQGYAKEASRAVVGLAFKKLRFHRVEAGAEPANRASISVARGIGMKPEGLKKGYVFNGRRWLDLQTFAARAEDFGRRGMRPSVRVELGC